MLGDDLTTDQVLLNDLLEHLWITIAIPSTFGINDSYWAIHTDTKAV
jgi:hypothetical protein